MLILCECFFIFVYFLNLFSSCSKELGQWDLLMEFGKTKGHSNPFLGKIFLPLLFTSLWLLPFVSHREALYFASTC